MIETDPDATRIRGEHITPDGDPDVTRIRDDDTPRDRDRVAQDDVRDQSFQPVRVGDFTLQAYLGEGGFAQVYLAEDHRTGRQVALKQLLPEIANSSEITQRFRSVAERSEALEHANIIAVYGWEVVEGRPALVMEYVEGESLRQVLRERGRLPVDEALDIAIQLCDALIYAHDNGFIHRDVKPDNTLIAPEGVVKLGDFDMAKVTTSSAVTRVGVRIGTPFYMSPEQIRGLPDVDARSDVFSMGTVLYEMVTGEVPVGHLEHPSDVNRDLPRRLGSVILKALARDRGARYESIRDLRDALTGAPETQRAQRQPFHFRKQRQPAETIGELVELCEGDWESARWHLSKGHFERWMQAADLEMARQAQVLLRDENDPDLALERLLHLLDPTLPDPVLAVSSQFEIDLGDMAAHESRSHGLVVSNPSRGYLVGLAAPNESWVGVEPAEFRLKEGENLQLTITAVAPASLGEHSSQVTLESNGGRVNLQVGLRTANRLLFAQARQSAGSVAELVELCNTHRDEAVELFYSGVIGRWLEEGLLRFDLLDRAQELSDRYGRSPDPEEREKGLRAFLLACAPEERLARHEPFNFRTGETAATIPELVRLCEEHWTDAKWHLYEGHYTTWLEIVEPVLVAEAERIREAEADQDLGLERFLHLVDPALQYPELEVDPSEVDLGGAAPGERKYLSLTIQNGGRGYLTGSLILPKSSWIYPVYGQDTSAEAAESREGHLEGGDDRQSPDGVWRHVSRLLRSQPDSVDSSAEGSLRDEELDAEESQSASITFGCMPGGSRKFDFVTETPPVWGEQLLFVLIETNGGRAETPVRVHVAPRLLLPEANASVGSLEELAEVSSRFWGEARTLWSEGMLREWLHQGLRRFDLVGVTDEIMGNPDLSADVQLTRFLLHACPECQRWTPPLLQANREVVDLGAVLHRTPRHRLRVNNLGGGDPEGLRVVRRPDWVEVQTLVEESTGTTLELVGDTRTLRESGPVEGSLVLEWKGSFGDTTLEPQRLGVSITMQVAESFRIGRWRIPYDGEVWIGGNTIPIRGLWVAAFGLVAFLIGLALALVLKEALVFVVAWLLLWLLGCLVWVRSGLGYRDIGSLVRDMVRWVRSSS